MGAGRSRAARSPRPGRPVGLPRRLQQHRRRVRLPGPVQGRGLRRPGVQDQRRRDRRPHGADVAEPGRRRHSRSRPTAAKGRYVRVTATKLAPRQNDFIFALAELEALDAAGKNLAAGASGDGARLDRGPGPLAEGEPDRRLRRRAGPRQATSRSSRRSARPLIARVTDRATADGPAPRRRAALADVDDASWRSVPPTGLVYAGTVYNGGTRLPRHRPGRRQAAADPRPQRGDVTKPGKEVGPGTVDVIRDLPGAFDLPADHPGGRPPGRPGEVAHRPAQPARPGGRSSTASGSTTSAGGSWTRRTTSAGWASSRRTPSCSTGWPPSSATAASRSRRCTG